MTNSEIILRTAIESGTFTEAEVESFVKAGRTLPFHTLKVWEGMGYKVRCGEHGVETRLWKVRKKKEDDIDSQEGAQEASERFYLTTAYLFTHRQVERKEG